MFFNIITVMTNNNCVQPYVIESKTEAEAEVGRVRRRTTRSVGWG